MSQYPTVLVFGATGRTGGSIINGLLESKQFHVAAAIRPASQGKSSVSSMKARGVDIRIADIEALDDSINETLRGVDIVISAVDWTMLQQQRPLIDAAKKAGVKRFIPCDWGTACVRGLRVLHDEKLSIHDYIQEIGLGYTFIDVGWWFWLTVPVLNPEKALVPSMAEGSKEIYGDGNTKNAATDLQDVGRFVARIIADPRTLNRYVFCWSEEVTQKAVFALAEKITGQNIPSVNMSKAEVERFLQGASGIIQVHFQYVYSIWIRGDNTVENAKKPEYGSALDARALYPDFKPRTLAEYMKEFYDVDA